MDHVERARSLFADDKLLQAKRPLDEARAALQALAPGEAADALRARLEAPDVRRMQQEIGDVHALMEALNSSEGWTLSYGGASTKVWYRHEHGAAAHSLRVRVASIQARCAPPRPG